MSSRNTEGEGSVVPSSSSSSPPLQASGSNSTVAAATSSNVISGSGGRSIDFDQLEEGLSRFTKKQRTTVPKTLKDIDSIISTLTNTKNQINLLANSVDDNDDTTNAGDDKMKLEFIPKMVSNLHKSLSESKVCNKLQSDFKELHGPISKFNKTIDKSVRSDIEQAAKDIEFDPKTINNVILLHFYREGWFDIAEAFTKEVGSEVDLIPKETVTKFIKHHEIMKSIENKDLQPAINWCKENREELLNLEFKLHKLKYIHLLVSGKQKEALIHAKQTFPDFSPSKLKEIQHLMGALIYVKNPSSPYYRSIFDINSIDTQWQEIKSFFSRESFRLMGLAQESPATVTITVGVRALPTFIKLSSFSVLKNVNDDQLTVEVDVDKRYKYHSVFACPVSREQTFKGSPPVLLTCGHLISFMTMHKLVKSNGRFKCPYCPTEQNQRDAKHVIF